MPPLFGPYNFAPSSSAGRRRFDKSSNSELDCRPGRGGTWTHLAQGELPSSQIDLIWCKILIVTLQFYQLAMGKWTLRLLRISVNLKKKITILDKFLKYERFNIMKIQKINFLFRKSCCFQKKSLLFVCLWQTSSHIDLNWTVLAINILIAHVLESTTKNGKKKSCQLRVYFPRVWQL